jgi:hypothetical protein
MQKKHFTKPSFDDKKHSTNFRIERNFLPTTGLHKNLQLNIIVSKKNWMFPLCD